MYSRTELIGHLGGDVERKVSAKGDSQKSWASFSVATKRYVGGGKEPETMWHNVTVFGQQADFLGQYAKKGMLIHVIGEYVKEDYTSQDGPKTAWKILGSQVNLIGHVEKRDAGKTGKSASSSTAATAAAGDEIPF